MFSRYVPLLVSFTSTGLPDLTDLKSSLVRGRRKLIDLVFRSDKVQKYSSKDSCRSGPLPQGHGSRHDESRVSYGRGRRGRTPLGQAPVSGTQVCRTLWITTTITTAKLVHQDVPKQPTV